MPPLSLYARARIHSPLRTRPRVQRAPGIPCALRFSRANPIKTRAHRAAGSRSYVLYEAQRVYEDLLGRKTMKLQRLAIAPSRESSVIESSRSAICVELSRCIAKENRGWGTRIPAQTRLCDQKPLPCSAFLSNRGGRVHVLWTITVDHSSHRGIPASAASRRSLKTVNSVYDKLARILLFGRVDPILLLISSCQ
jgi:hypothetical protein